MSPQYIQFWCRACNKQIPASQIKADWSYDNNATKVTFSCHGARETVTFPHKSFDFLPLDARMVLSLPLHTYEEKQAERAAAANASLYGTYDVRPSLWQRFRRLWS